jgi:hypothetical protein
VRFITTHGFWRSIALEAAWFLAYSAYTLFGGAPVFKFGNDSVTATVIRASISGQTARVYSLSRFRRALGIHRILAP